MTLLDVARATGARLTCGKDAAVGGVSIDTRTLNPGELFIAIKGKRTDGHEFVEQALAAGAAGVVISDGSARPRQGATILVGDTRAALAGIAGHYRAGLNLRAAAVTGSNGKTTTKELLGRLLGTKYRTKWAPESHNNDIGVPLTVLDLEPETEAVVFEIEMNEPGGTLRLAQVCRPQVGVITNVHDTHLEFMLDRAGVAREKAELLQALPPDGTAVLNLDDELVMKLGRQTGPRRQVTFGVGRKADVFAAEVADRGIEGVSFRLNDTYPVRLRLAGRHNVANCLAACAAASVMGIEPAAMPEVLAQFDPPALRLRVRRLRGSTLIDDCYNSNPQSLEAALDVLGRSAEKAGRVAVLGDMLELGERSAELHAEAGRRAAAVLNRLAAVGPEAARLAAAAEAAGMDRVRVRRFESAEGVVPDLFDLVRPGDTILVKGSRAMGLESVSARIASHYGEDTD